MATLLRYDLTTVPFPLQASPGKGNLNQATLTIIASNPNADPDKNSVTLQGIIISIPIGTDSTDLAGDTTDIQPVPPPGWMTPTSQSQNGNIEFTFQPNVGTASQPKAGTASVGGAGLSFVFNIEVNSQPGTVEIGVTEGSNNCQPPYCPTQNLYLTKFPNGWGDVSFWTVPDPPIVPYGSGPTLHWSGPAGATYTIEYYTPQTGVVNVPAQGAPALSNQGQYPSSSDPQLQLTEDTVFYLSVVQTINDQTYSAQQQITATIEVPQPVITLFTGELLTVGNSVDLILKWSTQYATVCTVTGDANTVNSSSTDDSYVIRPSPAPYLHDSYTLTAENAAGTSTSQITLLWGEILATSAPVATGNFVGIACSPDGSRVYVGRQDGATYTLHVLDPTTLQPMSQPLTMGFLPYGLACSPDGSSIFMTDGGNSVYRFNATTLQQVGQPTAVGHIPQGIAASPDGARLYTVNSLGGNSVSVLNAATLQPIGQPVPTAQVPMGIAVSPDSSRVYVAVSYTLNVSESYGGVVQVFEPTSDPNQPLSFVEQSQNLNGYPTGLAVSLDNTYILVSLQGSNNVLVLDVATLQPVGLAIQLPYTPYGIAISPDNARAFVTDLGATNVSVIAPSAVTGGING